VRSGGERGEVGDHELGAVGAAQRQHVALGQAVRDEPGRGLARRLGQIPTTQHRAGGTVDKGWLGRPRGRAVKDERVQRDLGELDVVVRRRRSSKEPAPVFPPGMLAEVKSQPGGWVYAVDPEYAPMALTERSPLKGSSVHGR
jgi:hypothetical protein